MTSLYLHIPFCKQKCAYCSFYSKSDYQSEYIDSLVRSVKHFSKKCTDKIDTVYMGGGTPSTLPCADIERIFESVYKYFNVCENAEITVECNPESIDAGFLGTLKKAGVNRLSIGVQSFDDGELSAIGRLHDGQQAMHAVLQAREMGFENISCDLIFGLPCSTVQSFEKNVNTLVSLGASHISCYNLQIEEGTPLFYKKVSVPDEDIQEKMYTSACNSLSDAGYLHYEISNFAKPGYESRHNSGYWTGRDYIGLGPSAHSKIGDMRFSFQANTDAFIKNINFEPDTTERITDLDFEKIMLGMRTKNGVLLSDIPKCEKYVKRIVQGGFADIINNRLILTDKGFYLSNTIISDIANLEDI